MKITKTRRTKISWTGDEQNGLGNLTTSIMRDQYVQAMRALVNEMEKDLATEVVRGAIESGNAFGTAGTNPFVNNLNAMTEALKILQDKGAPTSDLQMVLNTQSAMNIRNQQQLQKVADAGDATLLRQGLLGSLFGFNLRESAGFVPHENGTLIAAKVNGAVTKGATEITCDNSTGTLKKGDIIYFGADTTNKYFVAEDTVSGPTSIKLTTPLVADVADDTDIKLDKSYVANAGFARGSLLLATRLPSVPSGGDSAIDRTVITDPVSGISFEVAIWGGAYQNTITFANAWGCKNIKGEHSVAIIG